ncbi:ANKFN1 [Branchiostoma lanceolatum]|uniref:ANKFN1 protein n=1 Tax=Branchiostoma lanceolatum TaxID=7740 RepID=A0A8K0F0S0_BRALA|nr:ANKFN1 [Branchiostoma lanceolatum]
MSRYQLVFVELPPILEVSREDDTLDSEGQEEFSSSSGCEYSFADFKDILSPVKIADSPPVTLVHPSSTARNGSRQRTVEEACAPAPHSESSSTAGQVAAKNKRSNKRSRSRMDSMEKDKDVEPEELSPDTLRGKHKQDRRPSKPSNTTEVTIEIKPDKPKAERKLSRSRTLPSTPQKRRSSSADDLLRLQANAGEDNLLRLGKGSMGKSAQDCSRLAAEEPPSGPTTLCIPQIHVESTETTERRRRLLPQPPVDGSTIPTRDAAWRLEDDDNVNYLCAIDDIRIQTADTVIQELGGDFQDSRGTKGGQLSRLARKFAGHPKEERKAALKYRSISVDNGEDFYYPLAMSGRSRSIESLHSPSSEEMKRRNIPPATPPSIPPPTSSRVNKKLSNKHRGFSIDSAMGPNLDKGKRSRKTSYGPMPSPVLFDSVELQDLDAVRSLLNSPHCPDINSINEEGFTPLDVAMMTNNVPMSKMLITAGAVDNPRFTCPEARGLHLATLVSEAERKVDNIMQQVVNMGPPTSAQQQKEQEQQLKSWEWRFRLLKRMKAGFEHARPPGAPTAVRLGVSSSTSLVVNFQEPDTINGAMATRYKVEWSCFENFVPLAGEFILTDLKSLSYKILGLSKGNSYYVRVSACNVKGWGPNKATIPPAAVPSNWRELEIAESQDRHRLKKLEDLKTQIKNAKMLEADTISTHSSPKGSPPHMRRSMKKGLKNFFQSVKFHRNLKSRGVYLATILYHGDHILVTGEDNIPVVEVDDTFPSMLNLDLHWFMKVSCTWSDLRQLRQDLDRCASASSASFRSRLLQAAIQLQNSLECRTWAMCTTLPSRTSHGSIVIPTVRQVKDPKYVQSSSLKWVPISRLQRRRMSAAEDPSALERLLNRIPEIMHYNHNSTKPPPQGLYIGYLKLCSSMDSIGVLVPKGNPNMLPHCRIRDNPNVSSEEWDWVRRLCNGEVTEEDPKPSQAQSIFRDQLIRASRRLLNSLDVSEEDALQHRLFCTEVLELDNNVSMLLLVPPVEDVCCAPGQTHHLFQQDSFLTLPLQVFELVHMTTFQPTFFDQYATLSSQLEVENFLVQHQCREAFSDSELSGAKHRQLRIANFQQDLEDVWRGARWIMDVLQYARDRTADGGLLVERIYQAATPSVPKVPTQLSLPKTRRSSDSDDNFARRSPEVCSSTSDEEGMSKGTSPIPTHVPFSPPLGEPGLVLVREASPSRSRVRSRSISPVNRHKDASPPRGTAETYGPTKTEILTGSTKAGILRVYPDYHTGLAKGTSVKLHVTTKTTSREVIDLVVRQINKAGRTRDPVSPLYADDLLHNFFLVAIIAGRERQLPDTYQPLQLQNPWAKGKLLVRLRDQATAALAMLHETQSTSV